MEPGTSNIITKILHNIIKQKRREIHKSHNRVYTVILWAEIETLQWVLAQILTVRRRIIIQQQTHKED
jgi:hypothetical protein